MDIISIGESGSKGMVETSLYICLFWQHKWDSGPVEFVSPYDLSFGLFVLAAKSNIGTVGALL